MKRPAVRAPRPARPDALMEGIEWRKGVSADRIASLVERGADPDARDTAYGWTPAMMAASYGHADAVSALVRAGADPCALDHAGMTAMHHAVEIVRRCAADAGVPETMRILADAGCAVDVHGIDGRTPLSSLCRKGKHLGLTKPIVAIATWMIDHGAGPFTEDPSASSGRDLLWPADVADAANGADHLIDAVPERLQWRMSVIAHIAGGSSIRGVPTPDDLAWATASVARRSHAPWAMRLLADLSRES